MTWLITGGAGYIGAHVVRAMTDAGERVVVLDDLSAGSRRGCPRAFRWSGARRWTASC
ncbi:NAD-dependent epimerase/dehydratase family protein [Streptomyces thermocarboxydus]